MSDPRRMSGFGRHANAAKTKGLSVSPYGQSYPQHYPQPQDAKHLNGGTSERTLLGTPLSIRGAAELIGCSAWTVRQQHVPRGLPCFRSGPNGKLIFYRDQVIAWILSQQKKGGNR